MTAMELLGAQSISEIVDDENEVAEDEEDDEDDENIMSGT
jgi:hypothetical protein